MSEREKVTAKQMNEAMKVLPEAEKKYILGMADGIRIAKEQEQKKKEDVK